MLNAAKLHANLWKPTFGSVSATEANFLESCVVDERPRLFVELGTATGLSSVIIYEALRHDPDATLVTVDLRTTFYNDPSKPTGFLIDEHFGGCPPGVQRVTGITSARLHEHVQTPVDMAFVDAHHGHPWPTIDTLMLWPLLKSTGSIIYHDLTLYQRDPQGGGIGPKYLYDQMPEHDRLVIEDTRRNMFKIVKRMSDEEFHDRIRSALLMPWSPIRLSFRIAAQISSRLETLYPSSVVNAFAMGFDRLTSSTGRA